MATFGGIFQTTPHQTSMGWWDTDHTHLLAAQLIWVLVLHWNTPGRVSAVHSMLMHRKKWTTRWYSVPPTREWYGWFQNFNRYPTSGGQTCSQEAAVWRAFYFDRNSFSIFRALTVRTQCSTFFVFWTQKLCTDPNLLSEVPHPMTPPWLPHTHMQTHATYTHIYNLLMNHMFELANMWVQLFFSGKVIMHESWKRSPTVYCIHRRTFSYTYNYYRISKQTHLSARSLHKRRSLPASWPPARLFLSESL